MRSPKPSVATTLRFRAQGDTSQELFAGLARRSFISHELLPLSHPNDPATSLRSVMGEGRTLQVWRPR